MMAPLIWPLWLLATSILAQDGSGLTGFPTNIYNPFCAMVCLRSISSLMLDCSSTGALVGHMHMTTTTECWAGNTPYLTTLAWCMHVKCDPFDIPNSKLEYFWETQATGQSTAGAATVPAKWSYAEALANVTSAPTNQLKRSDMWLNTTSLVAEDVYLAQWNVLTRVQGETTTENTYGIAMLVVGFGLPVLFTSLRYVPGISKLLTKIKPYLLPSIIGTYQLRPLPYLLGNAPTVGQSLYIGMFVILNIVLTCVGYQSRQPNAWYPSVWREIMAYVLWRTGMFAYILMPLLFLLGGRNNILLWMTNWSHSTFLLLHRWIARIFTLHALLHSILAVIAYKQSGMYDMQVRMPYWIWGIVATICTVILCFGSCLYVRKFYYEIFLLTHIVLSVILVAGCWYHYYDLYRFLGGVLYWIYAVCAVWCFDRVIRIIRVVAVGPCRAQVTELGEGYVRIEIPRIRWGAEPGKHVYVYFPTLKPLQPWENHPFSVLPTAILRPSLTSARRFSDDQRSADSPGESSSVEKHGAAVSSGPAVLGSHTTTGLTLYVRKSEGVTKLLCEDNNLLTLLEGPYPNNSTREVLRCDRLLLISGGIGITAILPFVVNHQNVKLVWSAKESARCLVNDLDYVLRYVTEKDVRLGSRVNVLQLIMDEVETGWETLGVVVSGPGGLCDDVRAAVSKAGKLGKTEIELEVEAYSW